LTADLPRGFPQSEFEARLARAQRLMAERSIDALLLSTEPEVRYFSGFLTQFWQSPTRPWFLVVPATGRPIAVIPEIGEPLMSQTWIEDIRTWPSPSPDDEGVSLLADVLSGTESLGVLMGPETSLRMPLQDFMRLRSLLEKTALVDATGLVSELRMVKSEAEISKISHICSVASDGFDAVPGLVHAGDSLTGTFRRFKIELLEGGADDVPYLVGSSAPGGYADVISPPDDRALGEGDILMMDTGAIFDGYFCDFARNYAIERVDDPAKTAYDTLYRATEAGLEAVRPGVRCEEVYRAMKAVIHDAGHQVSNVGRFGHGLGMQLTEKPSLTASDRTVLKPGMVLTLEPGVQIGPGRSMVHEENIVVTDDGAKLISRRAPAELPVIARPAGASLSVGWPLVLPWGLLTGQAAVHKGRYTPQMANHGRRSEDESLPGLRLAVAVGVLGLVATGALFAWLWIQADRDAAAQLETQLESVVESSEDALEVVGDKLVSLSGLFRSSVMVTPEEFQTFSNDIGLSPGVTGLGYIARVDHDDVPRFEEGLQAQHGDPIGVFELDEEGAPIQLEARAEHYPIQYVMPLEEVPSFIGYDVASDPRVADTIEKAVATGDLAVTPFFRISPVATGDTTAMLLAVEEPASGDVNALVGAIISFDELLSTNIPAGVAPHVSLDYDEGMTEVDAGRVAGHLEYGGRVWTLSVAATSDSPFAPERSGAIAVLAVGLVASGLASLMVVRTRQRIQASTALVAAEQATEAKNRFIASVSHELRTPLTAVLGFAEILKTPDGLTTDEHIAMMKAITEEATDLAHLIDDLLVAARGEIGQLSIAQTPLALRKEIEGVTAASGIGERLRVLPSAGGSETALGDPIRVRQIMRNLVENARRYGGDTIEIELLPNRSDVTVEVRDNGSGIPAEVAGRAFVPYEQFGETVGVTDSLGLGLAVSSQLAVLMGGNLRYERRNDWTVFSLTLPATRFSKADSVKSSPLAV